MSLLCFATQGEGHLDSERLHALLEGLDCESFHFDRAHRLRSAAALARTIRRRRPELVVMEGSGLAGGLVLIALGLLGRVRYVVSSGDAIAPYIALASPLAAPLAGAYERALCRRCAGFIGWTPYLAGRALTFGAPRAMTAPGWARARPSPQARERVRERLGIAPDALVVGLAGSLNWRARIGYGYGAELVRAVRRSSRADLVACVIGDGPGLERLRELAGEELGTRVLLPGRVPEQDVADHLAAFDLASLPQSVDGVGSFRYSTKLSEYLAAGLPVITGQIPAAYDLDRGFIWRLPGDAPWSERYLQALTRLLETLDAAQLSERRAAAAHAAPGELGELFDRARQQRAVTAFIGDILDGRDALSSSSVTQSSSSFT